MPIKLYPEFTASIINTLEALGMVYAIGGSFASIAYSEIRTTADIDISIVLPSTEIMTFVDAMQALGYHLTFDDVLEALMYKQPFNVLDPESGFDVIIYKMKYYLMGRSQKHLRDIGAMLAIQGAALDYDYIAYWANEIGVTEVWNQILEEYRRRSP